MAWLQSGLSASRVSCELRRGTQPLPHACRDVLNAAPTAISTQHTSLRKDRQDLQMVHWVQMNSWKFSQGNFISGVRGSQIPKELKGWALYAAAERLEMGRLGGSL